MVKFLNNRTVKNGQLSRKACVGFIFFEFPITVNFLLSTLPPQYVAIFEAFFKGFAAIFRRAEFADSTVVCFYFARVTFRLMFVVQW